MHIEHLASRTGAIVMVVVGESIIQMITSHANSNIVAFFWSAILSALAN